MRAIDADAVPQEFWEYEFDGKWRGCTIKDLLDSQPTIQPEPHWIPVTEDTPKEAGTYMCTCYDAGRRIVTLVKWQPRTKTWNLIGARAYWKVIAWYNLPEPYKGATE